MSTTKNTAPDPRHLRVFLASPGDVAEERKLALEVLDRLPDDPVFRDKIAIRTIAWDKPGAGTPMLATITPQAVIANGLTPPSECDIVLVILWSRLGTPLPVEWKKPDGSPYHSGIEWEYCNALEAAERQGKPKLLLYRRTEKVLLDPDDPAFEENSRQWQLVKKFFAALRNPDGSIRGGCNEYATPLQFKEELTTHLRALILELVLEVRASMPGGGLVQPPCPELRAAQRTGGGTILTDQPRIFISYARSDGKDIAHDLSERLDSAGFRLWRDLTDMEGGRDWWQQIEEAICTVEYLILVITKASLRSEYVRKEWRFARQEGRCVIPILAQTRLAESAAFKQLPGWMQRAHFVDPNEPEQWTRLIRTLEKPCEAARVPFMAGDPPVDFVPRTRELKMLISLLVRGERRDPVAITSVLQGAGGFGKTALARALCHNEQIEEAFDDGVLWVTLGEKPGDLKGRLGDLLLVLTGERPVFDQVETGSTKLAEALGDRRILMVIDDVWDAAHLKPFLEGGRYCARLITTRIRTTVPASVPSMSVDAMQPFEAIALLRTGLPAGEDGAFRTLADRLGEWPILLKLVNGVLCERVVVSHEPLARALDYINRALTKKGLTAFDIGDTEQRDRAVKKTVAISLSLLGVKERDRFAELAVFPEDEDIPLATIEILWAKTGGLDDLDSEDLCQKLFRFSLLLKLDLATRRVRLHDVIRIYLMPKLPQKQEVLHATLVEAYRSRCPNGWGNGPNDGYFFQNLPYHLKQAGESETLAALLADYHWIRAKIAAVGPAAVIRDYDWMPDHENLRLVQQSLLLSGHILAGDPKQLAGQLLGRLAPEDGSAINALLRNVLEAAARPTLLPIRPTLNPPGSPLIRLIKGHERPITTVAVTPDGRMALSASEDRTIRLWDLDSGQARCCLKGHTDRVMTVAVAGDGRRALSGSDDRTLRLWALQQGVELQTIRGHEGGITSLVILSDGQRALSGSRDCTLRLWDLNRAEEVQRFEGHQDWVTAVAAFPEGQYLLSGSFDGTVRLWDVNTGHERYRFEGHEGKVGALVTTPDGRHFVSADDQTLRLWDLETRHKVRNYVGHKARVTALAVTPDGWKLVSASEDRTLRLWDLKAGKELRCFSDHKGGVTTVALTPKGGHAVSGSKDLTVALWDLWGTSRRRVPGHELTVSAITITPDEKHIVSASADGTVRLWDLENGIEESRFEGHLRGIDDLAVCPDGRWVVSASYDKTLRVWDLIAKSELQRLVGHEGEVTAVAVTPYGNTAVSGSLDRTVRLWDLQRGCELRRFKGHEDGITAVTVMPTGQYAISASLDRSLRLWDLASGNESRRFAGHQDAVTAVAVTRDGRLAVSGSYDGTMRLWDISTGAELRRSQVYSNYIRDIDITPDGGLVVSAYLDYVLRVWDLKSFEAQATFQADWPITCCAVAWKRRWIVAGDLSGRIHVLEMAQ